MINDKYHVAKCKQSFFFLDYLESSKSLDFWDALSYKDSPIPAPRVVTKYLA